MGITTVTPHVCAVFLDRDGVLNEPLVRGGRPYPPASLDELRIAANVPGLVARLRAAGFLVIGVTNQPDVARGIQTRETADALSRVVGRATSLEALLACYHDDADACRCRKPAPGLLEAAAARYGIDLSRSFMVGDRWRDIEAGRRAGCRTLFLDNDYEEAKPMPPADATVGSLDEGVAWILGGESPARRDGVLNPQALRVKLFADGADIAEMVQMHGNPLIKGFTTNPTLMRKAGVTDYAAFARESVAAIPDRPISFEVFSDEFDEMERQAKIISSWGDQVYVKIPVTNTQGESAVPLVSRLSRSGVRLNVTAVMTLGQVRDVCEALTGGPPAVVSVFAGRIADTGRDPIPVMATARELTRMTPNVELLWASPRELLNVFQADAVGCDIITVPNDILRKLDLIGKDLDERSLETVRMFRADAVTAGFSL